MRVSPKNPNGDLGCPIKVITIELLRRITVLRHGKNTIPVTY